MSEYLLKLIEGKSWFIAQNAGPLTLTPQPTAPTVELHFIALKADHTLATSEEDITRKDMATAEEAADLGSSSLGQSLFWLGYHFT